MEHTKEQRRADEAEKQRDELLAALIDARAELEYASPGIKSAPLIAKIDAAIASVKGK